MGRDGGSPQGSHCLQDIQSLHSGVPSCTSSSSREVQAAMLYDVPKPIFYPSFFSEMFLQLTGFLTLGQRPLHLCSLILFPWTLSSPPKSRLLGRGGLSTGGTNSVGLGQRTQDVRVTQTWIHIPCLSLSGFMKLVLFLSFPHL